MTLHRAEQTERAWRKLKSGDGTRDFPVSTVRLDLDVGYGTIRVGIGDDGAPQLLVPTAAGRGIFSGLSGGAMRIRIVQYVVEGKTTNFIEVRSATRDLDDVFCRLVDEILRRLEEGSTPEQSVTGAVTDLRNLLKRDRTFAPEFLIGLFGELTVLERLLEINRHCAKSWTGPLAHRHDFSGRRICAEVKSSLRRKSDIVHISSQQQLQDPSDGRRLVLLYLGLEQSGSGGRTIGSLIEHARALSSSPEEFDTSLEQLELTDWRNESALWQERFAVLKFNGYTVDSSFPRISHDSFASGRLPQGITSVEYDVDLSHASSHMLDQTALTHALEELAVAE